MRAVNLLPRDLERQRADGGRAPILVAAGGVAAVTAAAVVLFMSASGSVSDQRSQLESVEAAIAQLPVPGQPAVAPSAIAQERTDRVAALAAAISTRVPVDRLLRELAFVLPEDAWLTGLTASAPAAGSACSRSPAGSLRRRRARLRASRSRARRTRISRSHACSRDSPRFPRSSNVRLTASARVEPRRAEGEKKKVEEAEAGRHVHHHRERSHRAVRHEGAHRRSSYRARVIAIAAGAVLVYALALWFLLVAPKRAEATTRRGRRHRGRASARRGAA